ncbi:MAG TPA: cache domain-containing protein [Patescibacteria group bacterium]|nr:cache domain-containing protein [Patescibacteria group bacterium]
MIKHIEIAPVFRRRFFLVMTLVGLVCVVYSWAVLSTVVRIEREAILTNQMELTRSITARIDSYLERNYQALQLMALGSSLSNSSASQASLQQYSLLSGAWDTLVLTDLQGTVISSDRPFVSDQHTVTSDTQVQSLLVQVQQGQSAYSDFFHSKLTGKPTIVFAVPVHDESGTGIRGALIGFLSWPQISSYLEGIERAQGAIIDSHNQVIAYHLPGNALNTSTFSIGDTISPVYMQSLRDNTQVSKTILSSQALFGKRGYLTALHETGYSNYRGNNWIIVFERPLQGIFGAGNIQIISATLIFMAVLFLLLPFLVFCRGALYRIQRRMGSKPANIRP